jgi:hypothetical protein
MRPSFSLLAGVRCVNLGLRMWGLKKIFLSVILGLVLLSSFNLSFQSYFVGHGSSITPVWAQTPQPPIPPAEPKEPVEKQNKCDPNKQTPKELEDCCKKFRDDPGCQTPAVLADANCSGNFIEVIVCKITSILQSIAEFFTTGIAKLVASVIFFALYLFNSVLGGVNGAPVSANDMQICKDAASAACRSLVFEHYGALGMVGYMVQGVYTAPPPVSVSAYLASIHPITQTLAASGPVGLGQTTLSGIVDVWGLVRNVSYALFILILVAIGLMIMFRANIDPRTVVTAQAALPNLVISLVLITFSFALAGLLIDIARLLQEVIRNLFLPLVANPTTLDLGGLFKVASLGTRTLIGTCGTAGGNLQTMFSCIFGILGSGNWAVNIVTEIGGQIINIVLLIFSFIIAFQLFIMLVFKYVNLLVKPIFAPLSFLLGALPGRGDMISGWFRGYLADVLTFPAVFFLLNLAVFIKSAGQQLGANDPFNLFGQPGSTVATNLTGLVALGILLTATKVPAMLEEALEAKPSGHVAQAGTTTKSLARNLPLVGNFF